MVTFENLPVGCFAVGFYDVEGTFFYVWEEGWGERVPELNSGTGPLVARVATTEGYVEVPFNA